MPNINCHSHVNIDVLFIGNTANADHCSDEAYATCSISLLTSGSVVTILPIMGLAVTHVAVPRVHSATAGQHVVVEGVYAG